LCGEARLDLGQRDVAIFCQHLGDQVRMGISLRGALVATRLARNRTAMLARHLTPTDRSCDTNPKTRRRGPTTHATFGRRNNSIPQILR